VLALALLGALLTGAWQAVRQLNEVPGTVFTTPDNAYRPADPSAPANGRPSALDAGGPGWETLNTPQKLALYPLAERWALMSEVQKRRWLALAQNFPKLPEEEQARLHERMTAWASLSAQQRPRPRANPPTPPRAPRGRGPPARIAAPGGAPADNPPPAPAAPAPPPAAAASVEGSGAPAAAEAASTPAPAPPGPTENIYIN